ncbi:RidA family protein, partial [Rhizobium ruizarguesonis]
MNQFPTAAGKFENSPYERLAALGIALPPPPPPIANVVTHV